MVKRVVTPADLNQMLSSSVCMYKNKPYFVINVNVTYTARCFNLLTQREEHIKDCTEETFSAPTTRVGFINVKGGVVYCTRSPIRRYKVGLSAENIKFRALDDLVAYPSGLRETLSFLSDLQRTEMADAIMNKYPTIEDAFVRCQEGASAVAFDKQFAILGNGRIVYKDTIVGRVRRAPKDINAIEFDANYAYLTTLLEKNYETALPGA